MNPSESIFGNLNYEPHWYALKTRFRHEKKVDDRLKQKGVISYLPLCSTYHNWSDRKKKITEPLFSCYLFVRIALAERLPVLRTDGAVHLVSFNNVPAPIPENQINSIKQVLQKNISYQKIDSLALAVGQKVEVVHGPLKGVSGVLTRIKDQTRLIISVNVVQQAISVDIDAAAIKPIENQCH